MTLGAIYRAQVAIDIDTGLPEDVVTNTWHFKGTDALRSALQDATDVTTLLETFYHDIDVNLASNVANTATIKVYDLLDPKPRVPIKTTAIALSPSTDFGLPSEVALCLSYKAATVSGDIAARRRGRIFLGPWANTVSELNAGRVRPTTTMRSTVIAAAQTLITSSGSFGTPWQVYSPSDGEAHTVIGGWVDNAWDTVRSRGTAATIRGSF